LAADAGTASPHSAAISWSRETTLPPFESEYREERTLLEAAYFDWFARDEELERSKQRHRR
jgi:hypothetical protein